MVEKPANRAPPFDTVAILIGARQGQRDESLGIDKVGRVSNLLFRILFAFGTGALRNKPTICWLSARYGAGEEVSTAVVKHLYDKLPCVDCQFIPVSGQVPYVAGFPLTVG